MSNHITLTGNATRDPEIRFVPSGAAVVNFGLACNRRWFDKQANEWTEEVAFFDVVCWRDLAENVAESVTKGTRLIVTGRMQQRSWETDNGSKRSKLEVIADEIGPSLRWATAQVSKNERSGPGFSTSGEEQYGQPVGAAPAGQSAPATAGGGYGGYDSEPFVVDAGIWTPGAFGSQPERMLP